MGGPAFIDKLHSMGLKFGIYGAASGVTCGVDPGQLYHEAEDAQTYADWGVDFVKSDNCASYALDPSVRFGALRDALNATGRPIFLSIEPFSMEPSEEVSVKISNMARIGCDIRGNIDTVLARTDLTDKWSPLAGPGYFNDPDMINIQNPPSGDGGGGLTLGWVKLLLVFRHRSVSPNQPHVRPLQTNPERTASTLECGPLPRRRCCSLQTSAR